MLELDPIPTVDELVQKGEMVDVLCSIEAQVGMEKILWWWQGDTTEKLKGKMLWGKDVSTLIIEWDGIPDTDGWEEGGFEPIELNHSLFNWDTKRAWRLDVALSPVDKYIVVAYIRLFPPWAAF